MALQMFMEALDVPTPVSADSDYPTSLALCTSRFNFYLQKKQQTSIHVFSLLHSEDSRHAWSVLQALCIMYSHAHRPSAMHFHSRSALSILGVAARIQM
jgi:hypothetical protein